MPEDVLNDDNGIVHQQPQRKNQTEEDNDVEGVAQCLHHDHAQQERKRDRRGDEQGVGGTHHQQQHQQHQHKAAEDVVLQILDDALDPFSCV